MFLFLMAFNLLSWRTGNLCTLYASISSSCKPNGAISYQHTEILIIFFQIFINNFLSNVFHYFACGSVFHWPFFITHIFFVYLKFIPRELSFVSRAIVIKGRLNLQNLIMLVTYYFQETYFLQLLVNLLWRSHQKLSLLFLLYLTVLRFCDWHDKANLFKEIFSESSNVDDSSISQTSSPVAWILNYIYLQLPRGFSRS